MQASHTWCSGTFFKFMPLTIFSNFLRLAMLQWLNRWCQSVAPALKIFATFAFSFQTLMLRRCKFFSMHASTTTIPSTLFTLQPSLSNSTFKPSEMSLLTEMRLFFIWEHEELEYGCKQHFTSNLHCGLDVPFANGLQNGVISHVHLPWNNGFVSGEPLSFKCHVLCCVKIDDPIVRHMIISTQGGNKHLFLIYTSLVYFFFLITLLLQTIPHKVFGFFTIKAKLFVCLMNFVKQHGIFILSLSFLLETS